MSQAVHGTSVAKCGRGGVWRAALITGPSGAGKSDLALRLIGAGWRLVSDDYSWVWRSGKAAYVAPPATIAGQIEARGIGIHQTPAVGLARLALVAACQEEEPERLPEPETQEIAGLRLPLLRLQPFHASAVEKVAAAIRAL